MPIISFGPEFDKALRADFLPDRIAQLDNMLEQGAAYISGISPSENPDGVLFRPRPHLGP